MPGRYKASLSIRSKPAKWSMWRWVTRTWLTRSTSRAESGVRSPASNSRARRPKRKSTNRTGSPKGSLTSRVWTNWLMRTRSGEYRVRGWPFRNGRPTPPFIQRRSSMDKLTIVGQHDDRTIAQMRNCLRDERATVGVLCADGHLGYAQPVGGVIAYHGSISVSGVGFDIACGNYAVRTDLRMADLDAGFMPALAEKIVGNISFGVGRRNTYRSVEHPLLEKDSHPGWDIPFVGELKREAASQLGTVGSGNHYVDVFEAEHDGSVWMGVHFGSRGLGHKIAGHYTKLAGGKNGIDVEPAVLAAQSDLGREYLVAMDLAGHYAYAGREWVVHTIVRDFMHGNYR